MAANESVTRDRTLRRVVVGLWIAIALLAVVAIVLFLALRNRSASTPQVLPAAADAPAATWPAGRVRAPGFALRDENGASFSLASLRGRPVLVTFIDPLCRDYCPTEAKRLTQAAAELPPASRPAIVAVSVNVYGNAAHILRQDRAKWNLGRDWRWGVGDAAALARIWKAYHIQVLVSTKKIAGVTVHQIGHTEGAYLVDAAGHQRALFLWPYDSKAVVQALRSLRS
jgi:protein SCO1